MVNLFRNIRKSLVNEGKTTKYLKYAIGEIVLVVIGILIALQVNNWNENRKHIQEAKDFRSRLINDISADIVNIEKRVKFFDKVLDYGYYADEEMTQRMASYIEDKWKFLVGAFHASQIWNLDLSTATYNEIQNSGLLGYVGTPKLLNDLSDYYVDFSSQLNQLNGGTTAYRDYIRSVIPIRMQNYIWKVCYGELKNLSSLIFNDCNPPESNHEMIEMLYEQIINDSNFKGLLTRRLSTVYVRNQVYIGKMDQAKALISIIQKMD